MGSKLKPWENLIVVVAALRLFFMFVCTMIVLVLLFSMGGIE